LTEEEIGETIRDVTASQDVITILIAHRLSTIMHADRIFVLERGRVVESGSHASLLEQKGLYYAMWRQQVGERRTLATKGAPLPTMPPPQGAAQPAGAAAS
jgi:ATP-binding cassette subfamily B protein